MLADTARPPAPSGLSASITMGWRTMLKIKHVPFQLFDVTVFPLMMTLLFTFLFGGALAGSPQEYVQFLIPGILVQTVLFLTVYTGLGLNTDIEKGLFDRFRSLPIWQPAPLVGALLGDVVRYSIAGGMVLGLASSSDSARGRERSACSWPLSSCWSWPSLCPGSGWSWR